MLAARLVVCIGSACVAALVSTLATAASLVGKPISIFTAEPGGSNDFMSRVIAQGLTKLTEQTVIVENRGGAGGTIAAQVVAKAAPDGSTLLFHNSSIFLVPMLRSDVPIDLWRDFTPVTLATRSPAILVVHPSLPVKSAKELVELAKAKPGALNYSSGGIATATHLAGELFKAAAGVNIVHVPYKGGGPALTALLAGQVQVMFGTAATKPHLTSGKLRALGVTSAQPSELFPGLPTVASQVPGYEATAIYGLYAPAKTPAAIVNRLNQAVLQVLATSEVKETFFKVGVETVGNSPEEFGVALKAELSRLGKLIKDAGIREE
jgi:tripartite-type tricarboxylate transporter receptor subunit TctC